MLRISPTRPLLFLRYQGQFEHARYFLIPQNQKNQRLHTSAPKHEARSVPLKAAQEAIHSSNGKKTPLSLLPFPTLLRSFVLTSLSSYPILLAPSLRVLAYLAHSSSPFLSPDRNPLLHFILKRTFYAQFCAGETTTEVKKTAADLKSMGFQGTILAYGKEIVLEKGEKLRIIAGEAGADKLKIEKDAGTRKDVQAWKDGTMKTVGMTEPGDFVALKFSGAGRDAMIDLAAEQPPSEAMQEATTAICDLAKARDVRLLFDAEQDAVQRGIDAWTIDFQRRYNKAKAVVYGTYQAYLRSAPTTLATHLATAQRDGFSLGVKLVRGAYLGSDPRHLFWDSREETNGAYDGITEALIKRRWNDVLKPSHDNKGAFPQVSVVLASHNHDSVKKAMALREEQTMRGEEKIDLAYGQLMGMADEVSCELVLAGKTNQDMESTSVAAGPQVYKYLVWGSVGECLKYLVRRAEENRDAVTRAKGSRMALRAEVFRRAFGRTD